MVLEEIHEFSGGHVVMLGHNLMLQVNYSTAGNIMKSLGRDSTSVGGFDDDLPGFSRRFFPRELRRACAAFAYQNISECFVFRETRHSGSDFINIFRINQISGISRDL